MLVLYLTSSENTPLALDNTILSRLMPLAPSNKSSIFKEYFEFAAVSLNAFYYTIIRLVLKCSILADTITYVET